MTSQNIALAALAAAAVVLLAGVYVAYNATVVVPREEAAAEQREIEERRANLVSCFDKAWQIYSYDWDNTCDLRGEEADCSLPTYISTELNEGYERAKDRCVTMFK